MKGESVTDINIIQGNRKEEAAAVNMSYIDLRQGNGSICYRVVAACQ